MFRAPVLIVEVCGHEFVRPGDSPLRGGQRTPGELRDVAESVSGQVAQDPAASVVVPHPIQRPVEQREFCRRFLGCIGLCLPFQGLITTRLQPEESLETALTEHLVDAMDGRRHEPRSKPTMVPQRWEIMKPLDKGVLHHIFHVGAMSKQSGHHGGHPVHVPPIEGFLGPCVPVQGAPHQHRVVRRGRYGQRNRKTCRHDYCQDPVFSDPAQKKMADAPMSRFGHGGARPWVHATKESPVRMLLLSMMIPLTVKTCGEEPVDHREGLVRGDAGIVRSSGDRSGCDFYSGQCPSGVGFGEQGPSTVEDIPSFEDDPYAPMREDRVQ